MVPLVIQYRIEKTRPDLDPSEHHVRLCQHTDAVRQGADGHLQAGEDGEHGECLCGIQFVATGTVTTSERDQV